STPTDQTNFEEAPALSTTTTTSADQPGSVIGNLPGRPVNGDGLDIHALPGSVPDPNLLSGPPPPTALPDRFASPGFTTPAGSPNDNTYLSETPGADIPQIDWNGIGALLSAENIDSRLFAYGNDGAISVSRYPGSTDAVNRELRNLEQLHDHGVRADHARGPVWVVKDGKFFAALIHEKRYILALKDFDDIPDPVTLDHHYDADLKRYVSDDGVITDIPDRGCYAPSPHLNETSLDDARGIVRALDRDGTVVTNFTLGIDPAGHVDLTEPSEVLDMNTVVGANLQYTEYRKRQQDQKLDAVIRAALESIRIYHQP
ncbi:MAG: hypothetical protein ACREXT_03110, partial [Gammaproteobacteria bacterium]